MIVAGIRPRSLALCPRRLANALISALRSRPGPVRALRRRPAALTLHAWLVYSRVQFLSVRHARVDLVRGSVEGERNCLLTLDLAIVREAAAAVDLQGDPAADPGDRVVGELDQVEVIDGDPRVRQP